MNYNLELPINQTSFGQVSICILREFHARGLNPNVFPIKGQVDLRGQNFLPEFLSWLQNCCNKALKSYKRSEPTFRLWHIHDDSNRRLTDKTVFLTFYETDSPTPEEVNIVKNNNITLFTSDYTTERFQEMGLGNVKTVPLGFDSHNFNVTGKKYLEGKIVWGLYGKLEWSRKRHFKILQCWANKYGNNPEHVLHAAIYNPFLKPQNVSEQDFVKGLKQEIVVKALGGKEYFNINFLNWSQSNVEYNDVLNSANIVLGLSGGEGWDLPVFHSVALGKHCLAMNCHSYKEYLNSENAILINPSSKFKAADGVFFHENQPFNQGSFFDFSSEDFDSGCDKVLARYRANPINTNGLQLQTNFTYKKTVDKIIECLDSL